MKKTNNKAMAMLLFLILALSFTSTFGNIKAYAQVNEEEVKKEEVPIPIREIKEIKEIKEKEVRFPNKLTPKEPANEVDKDKNTNTGVATPEHNAKASLTENVDNTNSPYPIHHKGNGDGELNEKYFADARQFISFKTKNGKTFHLIINHDETGENVMLLTEVSEDDLLNITGTEKPKEIVKEEVNEEPREEIKKEEVKPEKEEKTGAGMYLFVGLLVAGIVGAGYYFKVYQKKQEENEEDEEVYDEFEEDETEKEDIEDEEREDDRQDMEEIAIDSYDEEE